MKFWLAAVPLLFNLALSAQEASPGDQAKLLAGIAVESGPVAAVCQDASWQRYSREFTRSWAELEQRQLSRIRQWLPRVLGTDTSSRDPLFYMFSGPDFLYANTFFPDASVYVFCGLEPVGDIPDVTRLGQGQLSNALEHLQKSLNAVLNFSFFITKDMKNDLRASQLSGTLPILYVFIAALGNDIRSVEHVGLNNEGQFVTEKPATSGAKIVFSRKGGAPQTLYYFATDVSNSGLHSKPGFLRFCESLGDGNGLLKAASYLMHMDEFSKIREFLLNHGKTLVEDDSGIPYRCFARDQWDLLCIGHYAGPIELFKNRYQSDLATAYRSSNAQPLPFSFGYRWHPSESSLIIATSLRSVPKAIPVAEQ